MTLLRRLQRVEERLKLTLAEALSDIIPAKAKPELWTESRGDRYGGRNDICRVETEELGTGDVFRAGRAAGSMLRKG